MRRRSPAVAILLALGLAAGPAPPARSRAAASAPPRDLDGFALAVAPWTFSFPRDHASHPAFRTEWWYYTGHLSAGARRFGYELTLFRVGMPNLRTGSTSAWTARDLLFAHVALTDETRGHFRWADDARRPALGIAGADSARMSVWLERDSVQLAADGRTHRLRGEGPGFGFSLALTPTHPAVGHGEGGVSRKSADVGDASHYYSFTRLATRGVLRVDGDTLAVAGSSWMDHEFGSSRMAGTANGWDWFGLQLEDGRELMLYRLRQRGGGTQPFSSGTLVERDGTARHLPLAAFAIDSTAGWTSPRTRARYPAGWIVRVPSAGITLSLEPTVHDQELVAESMGGVTYWEGSVRVSGTSAGRPIHGAGYVELTGYGARRPF